MVEAALYARISADHEGRGLGVQRQREDCAARATALGWTITGEYVDNDVSASKSTPRPRYDALMADIASGAVQALVVYDLDRLTRRPAELESFMELVEKTGVALANVSGDVDLTNANGRMIARIKGAVARQEADRISERVKRQKLQRAEAGLPTGQRYRTFGYTREWELIEEEAAIVKEVFERAAKGEAKHNISRDLQARGVKSTAGGDWRLISTTRLLRTAKYAGLQIRNGEVIGKSAVPAIVSEALYEAVQTDRKPAVNMRSYMGSGILVCSLCNQKMTGNKTMDNTRRYRCDPNSGGCGRLSIRADVVESMLDNYMSNIAMIDGNSDTAEVADTRLDDIDAEIAYIHANVTDLADRVTMVNEARKRRKAIVADQAKTVAKPDKWQPVADYDTSDVSVKHARIKAEIEFIFVLPTGPGRRKVEDLHNRLTVLMADGRHVPGGAVLLAPDLRTGEHDWGSEGS